MNKTQSSTLLLVVEALSPRSNRATERCPFPWLVGVSCSPSKQQSSKKTNWSKDRSSSDWMCSFHVAGDAVSPIRTAPSSNKRLSRCHWRRRFVDKRNAVSPGVLSPPKRGPSTCGEHMILREPRRPEPVRRRTVRQKNCPWTPATTAAEITAPSVQRYSPPINEADTTRRIHERRRCYLLPTHKALAPHGPSRTSSQRENYAPPAVHHLHFLIRLIDSDRSPTDGTGESILSSRHTAHRVVHTEEGSRLLHTSKPVVRRGGRGKKLSQPKEITWRWLRVSVCHVWRKPSPQRHAQRPRYTHTHTHASGWVAGWQATRRRGRK